MRGKFLGGEAMEKKLKMAEKPIEIGRNFYCWGGIVHMWEPDYHQGLGRG